MAGFFLPKIIRRGSGPERENTHMSRTNKRHNRQIERHRRNQGPELFSQAADNELKTKAKRLARGLSKATIKHGSAAAAGLLLTLAESANYNDNPAAFDRALSLAEKWAKEPQVVPLDTAPQLPASPPKPQLTDGAPATSDPAAEPEILEAEWQMMVPGAPPSPPDAAPSGAPS
jgi:hypothetical protein